MYLFQSTQSTFFWIVFITIIYILKQKRASQPDAPPPPSSTPPPSSSVHPILLRLYDTTFLTLRQAVDDTRVETVNPDKTQFFKNDYERLWESKYARYGSPQDQIAAWKKDLKDNYENNYVPLYGSPVQ